MSLEKLYTIEVNDAVRQDSECPFCLLEEHLEKQVLDFTLGSSYMESDVREQTDAAGFCRAHMEKMYQYGNALGNGWILKTRLKYLREKYQQYEESLEAHAGTQQNSSQQNNRQSNQQNNQKITRKNLGLAQRFLAKIKPKAASQSAIVPYQEADCFVCHRLQKYCSQRMESFLYLLVNDPEFFGEVQESKGFCMRHFPELMELCQMKLNPEQREKILPPLVKVMNQNLDRMQDDIDWFIEKYDYRNKEESWKNSRDAIQRTIGKINGVKLD